ncbi:response regulator transcription factor [Fibrella sp. ES10-3-2-2]|nr:DNA-binding response regulator [Fibrella sp. ES10-3-2-2]
MPSAPLYRILLIDDHRLFNDGVKSLLDTQTDLAVCGQVFQARDAIPAVQATTPDLVLLDINLPGNNGIDIGKLILTHHPASKVLILTAYNQPKLLEEVQRAGLHGYLLKDATTAEMLLSIRTILGGKSYFDPRVTTPANQPADSVDDGFTKRTNLTFREVEIVSLIREGLSNEQIADRIHLSVETVKTHRKNIHFKLGINKVTDLVRFAIENGI